ncbi:hypothetical protein TEA_004985 [Camellia sinensis var. sinensis]|uniref:Uncharacterized protein n=1 Tax=Camellia sinensis var. sinensis TaxID=542762 RepID=A0A4S4EDZ5_CAMSN|nr:hypothetical protein TEA_004985 [Camellia sinensis var. sinensis]
MVSSPGALAKSRREYNIPDDVHLELAKKGDTPWGKLDKCPFTTRLCATQVSNNTYKIINGVAELNRRLDLNLGLAEIFHQYSLSKNKGGLCWYLKVKKGRAKLIESNPDKETNDDDFLWVSGRYEDTELSIPGWYIRKYFGSDDYKLLAEDYSCANQEAIRVVLCHSTEERESPKLLGFEPTYHYTAPRKSRVTDFLCALSLEPDPSFPSIKLVPLTAEQEMAKIPATESIWEDFLHAGCARKGGCASSGLRTSCLGDQTEQSITEPSKRSSAPPVWSPELSYKGRAVSTADSVNADKDYSLGFNMTKGLLLPADMKKHEELSDLKVPRSAAKSIVLLTKARYIAELRKLRDAYKVERDVAVDDVEDRGYADGERTYERQVQAYASAVQKRLIEETKRAAEEEAATVQPAEPNPSKASEGAEDREAEQEEEVVAVADAETDDAEARRFITLIDELYNHHCSLFCSAAASIDDLFQGTEEGTLFDLERQVFVFVFVFVFPGFALAYTCYLLFTVDVFQFETEIEGGKLRRDVLAEGNVSSGGAPAGIISMLSGEEEMFAFRRAVSRLIEMQTPLYLDGVHYLHPYFQTKHERYESSRASTLQSQQLF